MGKVTGDVDLVKPIKTTISTVDTNSLTELQSLRNKMVLNVKNKNHSDSALRDVENYFDQLGNLEGKIPVDRVKIYFKWLDSFDKGSWLGGSVPYTCSTNLLFEKACVLYNVAAMATQIGATQDLHSEDCMKKAVIDNKKNLVIAKLAQKTGELYGKCLELMQEGSLKSLIGGEWSSVVTAKQWLYSALSQLHLSFHCKENKLIGEEIARLEIAQTRLNKCKEVSTGDVKREMLPILETVETNLKDAKKDNDFIYFEKVPSEEELPVTEGALVVKPTQFADKFLPDEPNLFSALPVFDPSAKKSECVIS